MEVGITSRVSNFINRAIELLGQFQFSGTVGTCYQERMS
jgi:hypothetical protein